MSTWTIPPLFGRMDSPGFHRTTGTRSRRIRQGCRSGPRRVRPPGSDQVPQSGPAHPPRGPAAFPRRGAAAGRIRRSSGGSAGLRLCGAAGEGAAIIVEPADLAALHESTEAALLPLLARSGDAPPAGAGGRGGHRFTVIASGTVAAVLIRDA